MTKTITNAGGAGGGGGWDGYRGTFYETGICPPRPEDLEKRIEILERKISRVNPTYEEAMPPKNFIEEAIKFFDEKFKVVKNRRFIEDIKSPNAVEDLSLQKEWLRSAFDQYRDEVRKVIEREATKGYSAKQFQSILFSHPLLSKTKIVR